MVDAGAAALLTLLYSLCFYSTLLYSRFSRQQLLYSLYSLCSTHSASTLLYSTHATHGSSYCTHSTLGPCLVGTDLINASISSGWCVWFALPKACSNINDLETTSEERERARGHKRLVSPRGPDQCVNMCLLISETITYGFRPKFWFLKK
jgi:hypothetical protein